MWFKLSFEFLTLEGVFLFIHLTRKLYVSKHICGLCIWSESPDIDN